MAQTPTFFHLMPVDVESQGPPLARISAAGDTRGTEKTVEVGLPLNWMGSLNQDLHEVCRKIQISEWGPSDGSTSFLTKLAVGARVIANRGNFSK